MLGRMVVERGRYIWLVDVVVVALAVDVLESLGLFDGLEDVFGDSGDAFWIEVKSVFDR